MIFILLYQSFCILLAYKNACWSNPIDKRKIKHWLNAIFHLIAASLIGYFFEWQLGLSCLLFTRVVFDAAMNIFRHLGLGYLSPEHNSWLDTIEKNLVEWLAGIGKKYVAERRLEWFAIGFRLALLSIATLLLFI